MFLTCYCLYLISAGTWRSSEAPVRLNTDGHFVSRLGVPEKTHVLRCLRTAYPCSPLELGILMMLALAVCDVRISCEILCFLCFFFCPSFGSLNNHLASCSDILRKRSMTVFFCGLDSVRFICCFRLQNIAAAFCEKRDDERKGCPNK